MGITSTTTVLRVADHELAVAWYSDLFGREPDRQPMEGSAERQLTDTSAVMVYADAAAAGGATLIVGVSDLDVQAAELYEREIVLEPYTVPSGQFRLAELSDRPATRHLRPDSRRERQMAKLSAKGRAALKPLQFGLPDQARTKSAAVRVTGLSWRAYGVV